MAQITAQEIVLRDGRHLRSHSAIETDALGALILYQAILNEGRYTLRTPDEFQCTEEDERAGIRREFEHPSKLRVAGQYPAVRWVLPDLYC